MVNDRWTCGYEKKSNDSLMGIGPRITTSGWLYTTECCQTDLVNDRVFLSVHSMQYQDFQSEYTLVGDNGSFINNSSGW